MKKLSTPKQHTIPLEFERVGERTTRENKIGSTMINLPQPAEFGTNSRELPLRQHTSTSGERNVHLLRPPKFNEHKSFWETPERWRHANAPRPLSTSRVRNELRSLDHRTHA
jgi:hypothetical protein